MTRKPKTQQLSPTEYKRILDGLEIVSITVDDFKGKVVDREAIQNASKRIASLKETTQYEHMDDGITIVLHKYTIAVNADTARGKQLFSMVVTFRVQYKCNEQFSDEFFNAFSDGSLRLQTAPYARAWVHDHCLRMGLPPLMLPLFRP